MSKMQELIDAFVKNQQDIYLYVPGKGYLQGKVQSRVDDVVTLAPIDHEKVVLHYTLFSYLRD